jgi:hypothetical protein
MFRLVQPMGVAFPMASGGGGAAAFSPSSIAGLQLHRTPADIASFADAAAIDTFTATVGGTVSQGTANRRPTAQTNELNGYAVVRYDGGDALVTTVSAATKPFTKFAVVKATDFTGGRTMMGASAAGGIQYLLDLTSGKQTLNTQATAAIGQSTTGVTAATWTIVAATYSNVGAFAYYLAGVADGTGTVDRTPNASTVWLGSNEALDEAFLGDMAEELQYDTVLSTANLNLVGGYLSTKYGLTWTGL